MSVQLFTIGFAGTTAEQFFTSLRQAGVKRVVDVRLNNTSQLAAFSKKDDLRFFLREVAGIDYVHVPELAPTKDMLDTLKKHKGSWDVYEQEFNALMAKRGIENTIPARRRRSRMPALQREEAASLPPQTSGGIS